MVDVAAELRSMRGARHVMRTADDDAARALVTAYLVDDAVDGALKQLRRLGVAAEDTVLVRLDSIGQSAAQRPLASVVWSDLLSQAGANSRPFPRYLMFVAAILALETRASSAVGVAISVTTIPASSYLGVAAGVGEVGKAGGALLVLVINVTMLLVGGYLTLQAQRRLAAVESRHGGGDRDSAASLEGAVGSRTGTGLT